MRNWELVSQRGLGGFPHERLAIFVALATKERHPKGSWELGMVISYFSLISLISPSPVPIIHYLLPSSIFSVKNIASTSSAARGRENKKP
ncbi:hypothetical protein NIES4103_66650 [Nostoc sp. NIES-4103]|nr:hypothetical protein NIES4103_66650 [Nostoc sp. NIES-4103]